ncbi:MAG TPA: PilW family protein [Burkholderiales bacterium]
MTERGFSGRRTERGLTMVELMVGLVIALIGSIVIFQVFLVSENYKRSTTGGSDAIQSANFSLYQLEREFSGAGAGLARMTNLWGCLVQARRASTVVLGPGAAAFPAPFDVFASTNVRIAPVLISDGGGATPDVVLGISGANDSVNTPVVVTGAPTAANVSLASTLGVRQNDLLMVVEQGAAGNPCPLAQVDSPDPLWSPPVPPMPLMPNPVAFAANDSWTTGFSGYSASAKVANLGPAVCPVGVPCERPRFVAFGVGTDPAGFTSALLTYDLLFGAEAPFNGEPISIADNVVNLQAVYGVAATPTDPTVAQWVPPTAPWDLANLTNGGAASADLIARIRAVRITVVARNAQWEKDPVSPATVTLFADLPVAARVTVNLTAAERQYRYRQFDAVIPLRNMLLANN